MILRLCRVGDNETVAFAVEELRRYLYMIDSELHIECFCYDKYEETLIEGLWIMENPEYAPKVPDVTMDDAFKICIKDNKGYIAGTNPISVLIGVYSLLKKLGCAWVRPGIRGEIITKSTITELNFDYEETASYRFRGFDCGHNAEGLFDILDWIPKEGMNNFFKEHLNPLSCFKARYPKLSEEDWAAGRKHFMKEMKKRGIKYHTAGHGWHMQAINYTNMDKLSGVSMDELTEEQISCLAMRDGKRCLYRDDGMISGTQLCYSQKHLRDRITSDIIDYLKNNNDVDYLHFWLADGVNNHCECEDCQKHRPSDWYVMMLNDLDKRLTEEGITARIVCLIYVDLLWEPVDFKLENPDRFILMFAPITRTYDTSYSDFDKPAEKTPYVRNKLVWPRTAAENTAYLHDWQEHQLKGDSFLFDYHLMWNQYKAPGYRNLSRVIYEDMYNLKNIGLGGNISCEIVACQIPHDFPHRIMARTLWNRDVDYYAEEKQFFRENYGEDFELVFDYLDKVTKAFSVVYEYYNDKKGCEAEQKALAPTVEKLVAEFMPVIEKNIAKALHPAQNMSWRMLKAHADFLLPYARAYTEKYQGNVEKAEEYLEEFNSVCERIFELFPNNFNLFFSKYSVKFYCDEITDNGASVVLI